jgi:putative glutamine amidotransferase
MKKSSAARPLLAGLLAALAVTALGQTPPAKPKPAAKPERRAPVQPTERFLDTAASPRGVVRLAVFYPTAGSLRAILALKDQGFIPQKEVEVVGVFHVKEKTDYGESLKFVQEFGLSWAHFHAVSADLGLETLYRPNGISAEVRRIFELSDGLIFFGGPDIPPAAYGEKTELQTKIEDPYRHFLELSAAFQLLGGSQDGDFKPLLAKRPDFPVLGICLGLQTLNAATGGTLVQDVWSDLYGVKYVEEAIALGQPSWHTNPYPRLFPLDRALLSYMLHPIHLTPGSKFTSAMGFKPGDQPFVMSAHHQSAGRLGKGFRPAAMSLDKKVVEAIDHEAYPNVLGVQFHPEFPILWETAPRYKIAPDDKDLFACRPYLEKRPPSLAFHKKLWAWFFGRLKK